MLNGDVKLALLVVLGTDLLLLVGRLLRLLLGPGLLVLGRGRGLLVLGRGRLGGISHLGILLDAGVLEVLGGSGGIIGGRHVHGDAEQDGDDLHDAGITQLVLDEVGVRAHAVQLGDKLGIGKERGRLGVRGELGEDGGVVEHRAEAEVGLLSILLGLATDGVVDSLESRLGLDVAGLDLEGVLVGIEGSDWAVSRGRGGVGRGQAYPDRPGRGAQLPCESNPCPSRASALFAHVSWCRAWGRLSAYQWS